MTKIIKIFGRAGTGKTTHLLRELEGLFNAGVSPISVGMLSHTRAAVGEFISRSIDRFEFLRKDFKYFKTLHAMCYHLLALKEANQITKKVFDTFVEQYYHGRFTASATMGNIMDNEEDYLLTSEDRGRLKGHPKIRAMVEIDAIMRDCMIKDFNYSELYNKTGNNLDFISYALGGAKWDNKYKKLRPVWYSNSDLVSPDEQREFSTNWKDYIIENNLYDFPRMLEEVYRRGLIPPVNYLFLDEFQDFTYLQNNIYVNWRDTGNMDTIWITGDDAQALYRWAGGSANYILKTMCDEKLSLPITYRHGKEIFNNSYRYIKQMTEKEPCDVAPADIDGEVIRCYGDEWLSDKYLSLGFGNNGNGADRENENEDEDKTVLILAATNRWARQLKAEIEKMRPKSYIANLGDMRKVYRVFKMYNTIAALERGESVGWDGKSSDDGVSMLKNRPGDDFYLEVNEHDDDDGVHYAESGSDYSPIKPFLISSFCLPTSMIIENEFSEIFGNFGYVKEEDRKRIIKKKKRTLKNVKSAIKRGVFDNQKVYNKETFEKDFLTDSWDGQLLIRNIPDIVLFPNALDRFPQYVLPTVKNQAGSIHAAKGKEADVVFLGMAVPRPSLSDIYLEDVRNDILREFYVGTSRAKYKIIEIYDYLRYGDGSFAPAPFEVIS